VLHKPTLRGLPFGVDTLLLVCSFGNLAHAQVCRSLELFAQGVIRPRQAAVTATSR